jgi:uncharacterized protein YndB with AHSA1/START domain
MKTPDGQGMPNPGLLLEVVRNERIVFTDAFAAGCQPREGTPFMTVSITLPDEGGKTRWIAGARHWSGQSTQQQEAMQFHAGWSLCADRLEALATTL